MKNIGDQTFNLPRTAPVMVLPDALLFPNALVPLFIFEPRYREMLAWTLERQRMFCIALMKPGVSEAATAHDFHHTAGLGMVRACVGHDDGTSHLILQGLARVRFTGFVQDAPFRIAELRELRSEPAEEFSADALTARARQLCDQARAAGAEVPEEFDEKLAKIDDPSVLCDVIAHTFLRDAARRQAVLEELRVGERLRLLIRHLSAERE